MPKTPEEWLQIANADASDANAFHTEGAPSSSELESNPLDEENFAPASGRGRLKIYLGFAAGVGKSYRMLEEGNRRRARGQDVVIGFIETHGRAGTLAQLGELEQIPLKKIEYRGAALEEMNLEAILERRPQICLVDELPHTNAPGSKNAKRWQDVEELLANGITVLSALNVQHLESLGDAVFDITGVKVRETVPDHILKNADEVTIVDITPRALQNRLRRGDIYKPEKVENALQNFFREGNLNALREIALREIAREVDDDVSKFRREKAIEKHWNTGEKVMVCISPTSSSLRLLRRGFRIASRLQAEIVAVYVASRPPKPHEQGILDADFTLCEKLDIPVVTLLGRVDEQLIRYAREKEITQIVLGHSSRGFWERIWKGDLVGKLTRELRTVDLLIVTEPNS